MNEPVTTVKAVIDTLGGARAVAEQVGKTPQAVFNWCSRGRIPATTYPIISALLAERGKNAPLELWGMEGPG